MSGTAVPSGAGVPRRPGTFLLGYVESPINTPHRLGGVLVREDGKHFLQVRDLENLEQRAREAAHARYEEEEEVYAYSCGSNYCDDPACIYPHPELL